MKESVFALTPAKPGSARRPSFQAGVADADGPCRLRADEVSGRLSFGLAGWRAPPARTLAPNPQSEVRSKKKGPRTSVQGA